jgi:hypothetical protein
MTARSQAEEHLRVIRSLMEKATIYRAISAEAAAVGGVLAVLASFAHGNWFPGGGEAVPEIVQRDTILTVTWLIALLVTGTANFAFLYRHAVRRGDHVLSAGMRLALVALAPSFIFAGALTVLLGFGAFVLLVPFWISLYGLGLLGTSHFAPRSLVWLGWAFLFAGIGCIAYTAAMSGGSAPLINFAQGSMALTFGLFHLVYAACTWPRRSAAAATQSAA